jgi:hypothetical protein
MPGYIRKTDRKHSTKDQVQHLLLDVRRLRDQDKTDSEVREILGVGIIMYQEYMQRIHEEDRLAWNEVIKDELESEILAVRNTMLYCCRYAKEQLKDKNVPSSDKLEWINTLQGTRTNMLKLLVEGPEYLKTATIDVMSRVYIQSNLRYNDLSIFITLRCFTMKI